MQHNTINARDIQSGRLNGFLNLLHLKVLFNCNEAKETHHKSTDSSSSASLNCGSLHNFHMSKHTTDYLIVSENYSYVLPLCKILHYQMSRIY